MSSDDLTRPLGLERPPAPAVRRWPLAAIALGLALTGVVGVGTWVALTGDPIGGEPHALASIDKVLHTGSVGPAAEKKEPAAEKGRETASELEDGSGVKVIRGRNGTAPGAVVIRVPDAPGEARLQEIDRRLSERGRHGPLPKISAEAGRAREVYARPFDAAKAAGKPLVAIVVTGLGLGATVTGEAITRLPADVSLAFAPYGADLERQAARAREAGHEILLQAPMEGFGGEAETGPQALLAEAPDAMNRDRLHWLMARFQGYVGITNFMGAKFSGARPALKPVLEEMNQRGLLYVDDGSTGRSLAGEMAAAAGLPASKGDVVLDGLKPAEIDTALARAEAQARANGKAIVFGAALPATIERLNRWARSLEQKGLVLAPVSAVTLGRRG